MGMVSEAEKYRAKATALSPEQAKLEEVTRLFVSGRFRESEALAGNLSARTQPM